MRAILAVFGAFTLAGCNTGATDEAAPTNTVAAEPAATEAAIPDLKGKWVGTSESIVTGIAKHHEAPEGDAPLLSSVEFTYVVEGQDGRRFWGTLTSPNFEEDMIGIVAKDGKTIVARSSEGEVRGTIADPDTIDITYSAGGDATVVAVNTWKRAR